MVKFPIIFLAFANDAEYPSRFLKALKPERDSIKTILINYMQKGWGQFFDSATTDPGLLTRDLNKFYNQLIIFHFSGHANGTSLAFEDDGGKKIYYNKTNLKVLLSTEKRLKLVFLNACATQGHVEALQEIGVPAIIATQHNISDESAKVFSTAFYDSIVRGNTLKQAFLKAKATIQPSQSNERIFRRSIDMDIPSSNEFSWGLHIVDESILDWKLEDEVSDLV
ncbi:MAG: CHAT domain-containing protein, partial [Bacteroidota bacterium]